MHNILVSSIVISYEEYHLSSLNAVLFLRVYVGGSFTRVEHRRGGGI